MNNIISSKLTLYDILAMFIPGALILIWINVVILKNLLLLDESEIDGWIAGLLFVSGSYLVGILWCKLMEALCNWTSFRNNKTHILNSFKNVCSKINSKYLKDDFKELVNSGNSVSKEQVIDYYYEAYAFVQKNTYRNVIDVLESQFAFLRSMLFIVLGYIIAICFGRMSDITETYLENTKCFCVVMLFLILFVGILLSMAAIQKKIYSVVWEDYEYLSRIKNKEKQQ